MILLIDNYDSFVYNLAQYVSELGYEPLVKRNDTVTLPEIQSLNPSHIIISPGPCDPLKAGISIDAIKYFGSTIPVLGICLGHQAIAQAYGGKIIRAPQATHGKSSLIKHDEKSIFANIPNPFKAGRYHSLSVAIEELPKTLTVTAWSENNEIMALKHQTHPVFGLQFHPESILTDHGHAILHNFLTIS